MPPYPTKSEIEELASHLSSGNAAPFMNRVSPNVVWDVMGTHPCAGHFTSLDSWKKGALDPINERLTAPLKLHIVNVSGGGDQPWVVLELEANGTCKNGADYPQRYAWIIRFDEEGTIVQIRAYLDSALVQKAFEE